MTRRNLHSKYASGSIFGQGFVVGEFCRTRGAGVMRRKRWGVGGLTGAAVLLGSIVGGYEPALAGSDNSTDTYAGDYAGGSFPAGTFFALQYLGYFRGDPFIDSAGRTLPNSHANIFEEFTRFAYLGEVWGHKWAIDVEVPSATLTDVNIPGTNSLVAGGFTDPVVHLTYFIVADAKIQRWLGLTNYFYLPFGRKYDNEKAVNVSTARQFTDVPQIGYTEGLRNVSPALNGFYFDLIANASFHTKGNNPVTVVNPTAAPLPGVLTYDTLVQGISYDVRAYLRYNPLPTLFFVAVGIEKSWGGEQIATNGRFAVTGLPIVVPQPNLSLSRDDFFRGHFQFQLPITKEFAIAGDVFHDFARLGGFREDIGAEVRLTRIFLPGSR